MLKIKKDVYNAILYFQTNSKKSISFIANLFNIDRHTLSKYKYLDLTTLIFSNYFNCYILFDEKELLAINEYLNTNISYSKIKEKYGYKQERMVEKLLAIDVDINRKYKTSFNRNAFYKIENEEDAYILGFILADGYINENKYFLQIKLNKKDVDILEKIKKYLNYSEPIKFCKHNKTNNELCYINLNSKTLIENLKKYNIFQAKSCKEIPYYDIDKNLIRHYIRGIIDGDGFISIKNNKIGVCGSYETLLFIHNHLSNILDLKYSKHFKGIRFEETSNIYRLEYTGEKSFKIIEYLYKNSCIYLNRKYNLAMQKLNCRE